jgi:hypothetical protein
MDLLLDHPLEELISEQGQGDTHSRLDPLIEWRGLFVCLLGRILLFDGHDVSLDLFSNK